MTLKQLPDTNISRVYGTLVSAATVISIVFSGNQVLTADLGNNQGQVVSYANEKTNIYKSFTTDFCIPFNMQGYSNNKNIDSGIEKVIISEEKLENLKKLETIASLKDNWNGNDAKAFQESLITKVRNIITFLDIQPEVFPTACESLQLEYDKLDGSHMEIELTESNEAEIFVVDSMKGESITNIQASVEEINKAVSAFYG